jgi:uncharacterized membrane protein YbaN (DUF454 family)
MLLLGAGHVCVALGVIGAFLPLLPTTPFLLLAAACYVRASERHYRRLLDSRLLGPHIRSYREKGAVPLRTTAFALTLLWASLLFSMYRVDKPVLDALLVAVGVTGSVFILRIPTLRQG